MAASLGLFANVVGDLATETELPRAISLQRESMEMYERIGDVTGEATTAFNLGFRIMTQGSDSETAIAIWEKSLAVFRELGDAAAIAAVLDALGRAAHRRGDLQRAKDLFEQSIALLREVGDQHRLARVLHDLGVLLAAQETVRDATDTLIESLTLGHALGDRRGSADNLEALAAVAVDRGRPELAARFRGARAAMLQAGGLKRSSKMAQFLGPPNGQLEVTEY